MSRTISSSYTSGIVLTSTANNPVKVTGRISVASGIALEGTPGAAFSWTVNNYGTLISNAISPVSTALFLGAYTTSISSGTVVNESTGLISGSGYGVFVDAATGASVTNDFGGTIAGGAFKAIYISGGVGTIVNAGVLLGGNVAIYEYKGGTVTNLSTGTITGNGGVWFQQAGTFTNAGTITSTNAGRGVVVFNTTTGSSRLIVDPGAVFNGNIQSLAGSTNVVELAGTSTGTLAGFNGTTITNFATLQFDAGAKWTVSGNSLSAGLGSIHITGFTSNDTIDLTGFVAVTETFGTNAVTLTNAATQHATLHIAGTTFSSANMQFVSANGGTGTDIYVGPASLGHTLSSTLTSGTTLASPANNPFTITSAGGIAPTLANTTALYAPGGTAWTITNAGTITGESPLGSGIILGNLGDYVLGSTITNQTGGKITGSFGIYLYGAAPSSVVNQAGATIAAAQFGGIVIAGTSVGTVTNAGVISAPISQYALNFLTGSIANRVIVDPGAVFTGKVGGGDGVMQLASGASAGTLAGFGATITNFSSLQFDTGATWTVAGSVASGGLGTLSIGGFTAHDTIDLNGFVAVSESFGSNALVLTDSASAQATLHIQGAFNSGDFAISNLGSTDTDVTFVSALIYGQTIDETGIVATSETVAAGALTLFSGVTPVGTINVGDSLSTGDFTLASANGGTGTDVIVSTVFGTYTSGVTLLTNPTTIGSTASVSKTGASSVVINAVAGTAWAVTNLGTVTDASSGAIALLFNSASTLVNSGTIAASIGVEMGVAGSSVTNSSTGTIITTTGYDILMAGAGSVTNNGTIQGAFRDIHDATAMSLTNTGVILATGTTGQAVNLFDGGFVTNSSTGTISGGYTGIHIGGAAGGTIDNSGTILATASSVIYLSTGTITNSGLIANGGVAGVIDLRGVGSVTNLSGGIISDISGAVISILDAGNVTNNGTLEGGNGVIRGNALTTVINTGVIQTTSVHSDGVNLNAGGFITNSLGGTISASYGIVISDDVAGTVDNSGTVQGIAGSAIYVGTGTVINSGQVYGAGRSAAVYTYGAGIVTNLSTGTITGYSGVEFGGGYTDTMINAGTIFGGGGTAVSFNGGGTHDLIVDPGAVFTGAIYGGATVSTTAVMDLASASSAGTIGFGGSITNFTSLVFDPGAQWTVAGNDSASGLGTLSIAGFIGAHDTIDLTNLSDTGNDAVTSFNSITNVLTITADGGTIARLQLDSEDYTGISWVATNDGDGGTDVSLETASPAVLSGTLANDGVANETASTPFADLTVTDATPGANDTVTASLSNPAFGTLSNVGDGSYNSTTGVYTISGTPSAVTTAIDALILTPASPPANVYVTSTTLTVDVVGPGGGPAASSAIAASVQQILGLATVPSGQIAIAVSADGTGFAAAVGGDTNEAIVTNPTNGGSYTVPGGYAAGFLGGAAGATLQDTATVGGALLVSNPGNDVLIANTANDTIFASTGNDTLSAGVSATLLAGNGDDSINAAASAASYLVTVGSGIDTIWMAGSGTVTGGTGTDLINGFAQALAGTQQITSQGTHDTVVAGAGSTSVTSSGADALVLGGTGNLAVDAIGMAVSIAGAAAATAITLAGGGGLVFGGSGALTMDATGAADTVVAATGGAGTTLTVAGANDVVYGNSGTLTVQVSGMSDLISNVAGPLQVEASGSSNATIVGGGGASTINAGTGSNVLVYSGSAALSFVGGTGSATVVAFTASSLVASGGSGALVIGATSASVTGGAGGTTLFGGAGGAVTYDNVGGAGSLEYGAQAGSETLNASASNTNNLLYAGGNAADNDVLIGGSGRDTIIAASGTTSVMGAGAGMLVYGGTGSLSVNALGTMDTIAGAAGATAITLAGGSGLVFGGSGALTMDATGAADTVLAATGGAATTLTVAGANDVVYGNSGILTVQVSGASDLVDNLLGPLQVDASGSSNVTIVGGGAASTVNAGSGSNELVYSGSAALNFVGGAGSATVVGFSASSVVASGGSGALVVGATNASVTGGAGGTTLFGAAGGMLTYGNAGGAGRLEYGAEAGSETLNASASNTNNLIYAGGNAADQDLLVAGSGNDQLVAGQGSSTMTGGAGNNMFDFFNGAGGGHASITDFTSQDVVNLSGYGAGAALVAQQSAVVAGGNTTITLADNTQITFLGVSSAGALSGHIMSS